MRAGPGVEDRRGWVGGKVSRLWTDGGVREPKEDDSPERRWVDANKVDRFFLRAVPNFWGYPEQKIVWIMSRISFKGTWPHPRGSLRFGPPPPSKCLIRYRRNAT